MRSVSFRPLRSWLLLLLLAVVETRGATDELHQEILTRGNAKLQAQDFTGAIAEFTTAILAQPDDGEAYLGRAYARHFSRDLTGALRDYTKAIGLARVMLGGHEWHPALGSMYMTRGKAQLDGEKWAEALLDFNNALKCDPNLALVYGYRGFVRQMSGDLPGAMVDYDEMIQRDPSAGRAFHMRATVRQAQGDLPGAITDYRSVIKLTPEQADYSNFFIWLLRVRLGEQAAADEELTGYFKARPGKGEGDWEAKIAGFLLGRMTEQAFLQAATTAPDPQKIKGQECEAWYYSGMKRLMAGDRATAAEYFRKCTAMEMKEFTEYHFALTELKALP